MESPYALRVYLFSGLDHWIGLLDWATGFTFDPKILTRNGHLYWLTVLEHCQEDTKEPWAGSESDQAIIRKCSLIPEHITLSLAYLEQYSSPVFVPLIPCDSQAIYIPGSLCLAYSYNELVRATIASLIQVNHYCPI